MTKTDIASEARGQADEARGVNLRAFLDRHVLELRRFVASRIDGGFDVDDIVQQTLLQACVKLGSVRGEDLRPWVFSIARRLIVDCYRDRERASHVPFDDESIQDAEAALQTSAQSVHSHCEMRERIRCCMDCIRTLMPEVQQVAVLLSDVHGFTDQESAARLCMSVPAFKFMLHEARARLHAAAAEEQPGSRCALVGKTGVRQACPGCAHEGDGAHRGGAGTALRSGLGHDALIRLQRELVGALDANN